MSGNLRGKAILKISFESSFRCIQNVAGDSEKCSRKDQRKDPSLKNIYRDSKENVKKGIVNNF